MPLVTLCVTQDPSGHLQDLQCQFQCGKYPQQFGRAVIGVLQLLSHGAAAPGPNPWCERV